MAFNPIQYIKNIFSKDKTEASDFARDGIQEAEDEDNPLARMVKKIGYSMLGSSNRDDFIAPDFDLAQIKDAYDTDSNIRQALDKYIELMFKQGWGITYKDKRIKDYMTKRFTMLGDAMGQPISHFWKEISDDLVKYSNVFIVKKRMKPEDMPNMPDVSVQGLGKRDPVGAYFRLPPQTMQIQVDEHGTIEKYKQVVGGQDEQEFKPVNVIHIAYKKPAGRFFGVPFSLPVLDDVRLLRKMEDNVAKLMYRHLYPLFIYQVGLDKAGYEADDEEIEQMREEIQNMPIDGGLVVPERHDINLLTADENIDAEKYLDYFEKRVFTGLGVSETLMGRASTSNRSTAENQSSEMRDKVKAIQTVMQNYINHMIIRELLYEGGFDPIANPDQQASFKFNEIDIDLKIKRENHAIYKFEHNASTHEEMRNDLGQEPVEDESRLHNNMFAEISSSSDTDNRVNPQNAEGEGDKFNLQSQYESRISSLQVELKNTAKEVIASYGAGNLEYDEAQSELQGLFQLYADKVKYYIELSAKKGFRSGISLSDPEESQPGFDTYRNQISEEFKEYSQDLEEKFLQLLDQDKLHHSRLLTRCDWIEEQIIGFLRQKTSDAFNRGQLQTLKLNGVENITYSQDGTTYTVENEDELPDKPTILEEEGG